MLMTGRVQDILGLPFSRLGDSETPENPQHSTPLDNA